MDLNEAKQILKKNGYICEVSPLTNQDYRKKTIATYGLDKKKILLLDKYYDDEDVEHYDEVYGPCLWNEMEEFIKTNLSKDIFEIPINPKSSEEPEEGFILVSVDK